MKNNNKPRSLLMKEALDSITLFNSITISLPPLPNNTAYDLESVSRDPFNPQLLKFDFQSPINPKDIVQRITIENQYGVSDVNIVSIERHPYTITPVYFINGYITNDIFEGENFRILQTKIYLKDNNVLYIYKDFFVYPYNLRLVKEILEVYIEEDGKLKVHFRPIIDPTGNPIDLTGNPTANIYRISIETTSGFYGSFGSFSILKNPNTSDTYFAVINDVSTLKIEPYQTSLRYVGIASQGGDMGKNFISVVNIPIVGRAQLQLVKEILEVNIDYFSRLLRVHFRTMADPIGKILKISIETASNVYKSFDSTLFSILKNPNTTDTYFAQIDISTLNLGYDQRVLKYISLVEPESKATSAINVPIQTLQI